MKIGLLITGGLDQRSGGYDYDRQLVAYLEATGHSVEVLSWPGGSWLQQITHNYRSRLRQTLLRWDGDILIQDELAHPALWQLNHQLASRVRYPIVSLVHHLRSSEHHGPIRQRLYRLVERRYLRSVQGFIFNSRNSQLAVQALIGDRPVPLVIATPGAQVRPLKATLPTKSPTAGPLRILFVGNIIPRKNLHIVLLALGQLSRGSPAITCQLTIIGRMVDGPYYRRCQRLARRLTPLPNWLGFVSRAELAAAYQTHQVLAVPSDFEGFGMVYLEAMLHGLVPIGSNRGGAVEVIGDAGILVEPGQPTVVTVALQQLSDPVFRQTLSSQAVQQAAGFPDWTNSFAPIGSFLHSLSRPGNL